MLWPIPSDVLAGDAVVAGTGGWSWLRSDSLGQLNAVLPSSLPDLRADAVSGSLVADVPEARPSWRRATLSRCVSPCHWSCARSSSRAAGAARSARSRRRRRWKTRTWISGETWDYDDWGWGEPNNYTTGEDCLEITYADGTDWNDIWCEPDEFTHAYVCEFDL